MVVKSDFKQQSNRPDTILLQGHAVTFTFKVLTHMVFATRHLNMVIISIFCEIVLESDFKERSYGLDTILLHGHAVTLTFKVATQILREHIVHIATCTYSCTKFHAPSFNSF